MYYLKKKLNFFLTCNLALLIIYFRGYLTGVTELIAEDE